MDLQKVVGMLHIVGPVNNILFYSIVFILFTLKLWYQDSIMKHISSLNLYISLTIS